MSNSIHIYNEDDGEMEQYDDVSDVMATADDTLRLVASSQNHTTDGFLFKGEGRFTVWVDAFHSEGVEKYENIVDPVLMPQGVIKLPRSDGVTASMRGEILRLKNFDTND